MNHKITIPLFAIVLFLLVGCAKDKIPTTNELELKNQIPAEMQSMMDERISQLEHDYKTPPVYEEINSRSVVNVPAGSVNQLQAAINSAGPNGKVVVQSGDHWESGTVTISQMVRLFGEPGAKIYFNVSGPGSNFPFTVTNVLDPAIHVKDCNQVWIKGLNIYPQSGNGSTGIFLEKARLARIESNLISGFQFGIWASDRSNMTRLYDNTLVGSSPQGVWGIVAESAPSIQIKGNHVSKYATCIFGSDVDGTMSDNTTVGGFSGPLLCTVQGNIMLPSGKMLQNAVPCRDWLLIKNKAYESTWNYVVIDGANNNFLFQNQSYNPSSGQDIYLLGDSYLVGSFTPTSFKNFVVNTAGIVTVDCGLNNTVLGGTKLNGPCF